MRRLVAPALLLSAVVAGAASAPAAQRPAAQRGPQLVAEPAVVVPGETVVLRGRGFPRSVQVTLLAGPPHGEAVRIGSAQTGRGGGFTASVQVRDPSDAARLVVLACHDSCRVKARAQFRIAPR